MHNLGQANKKVKPMPNVSFHRRFQEESPVTHFCEQWNVVIANSEGDLEQFRVTFSLNKGQFPSFDVALRGPTGAYVSLNRKHHYARIKRVMAHLQDEFEDYKRNRNYQVKIT